MRGRGVDISEPDVVQPPQPPQPPVTSGRARHFSEGADLQIKDCRVIKTAATLKPDINYNESQLYISSSTATKHNITEPSTQHFLLRASLSSL